MHFFMIILNRCRHICTRNYLHYRHIYVSEKLAIKFDWESFSFISVIFEMEGVILWFKWKSNIGILSHLIMKEKISRGQFVSAVACLTHGVSPRCRMCRMGFWVFSVGFSFQVLVDHIIERMKYVIFSLTSPVHPQPAKQLSHQCISRALLLPPSL